MGLLDAIGAIGGDPNNPDEYLKQQGLLGLGAGLLSSSGWTDKPTSLGQAFGAGLQGMQQMREQAQKQQLERQKIASGSLLPADPREFEYLKKQFPDRKFGYNDYLNMKRKGYTVQDIGGVPTLVDITGASVGQPGGVQPGAAVRAAPPLTTPLTTLESEASGQAKIAGAKSEAQISGTKQGEATSKLSDVQASLPNMYRLRDKLSELGKKATYTTAGRIRDVAVRESGIGATESLPLRLSPPPLILVIS